jgi:plasmid stability protein
MARQLTIRNVPDEVRRRLEALARERDQSMSSTVLDILESALGVHERRRRLERYVTWSEGERRELERAVRAQRTIDR